MQLVRDFVQESNRRLPRMKMFLQSDETCTNYNATHEAACTQRVSRFSSTFLHLLLFISPLSFIFSLIFFPLLRTPTSTLFCLSLLFAFSSLFPLHHQSPDLDHVSCLSYNRSLINLLLFDPLKRSGDPDHDYAEVSASDFLSCSGSSDNLRRPCGVFR